MRNRNSASLPPQTDRSADSSTVTPPAGSATESTGGSLMEEQAVTKTKQKKKGGAGLNIMIVLFALVLLGGIGLIAYPTFANWWNSMHASRAVAGYVEQVKDMSGEQKKELLDQAHAYNQKLNTLPDRWHLTDEQMDEYNKTLDITGTGIMGYITIPKLEVRLPVYHGTEDTVLPNEMRDLDFDPNQAYATLITCTPYGVNSHRLLVRGHRIPTPAEADETQYDKADTNRTLVIASIALAIVLFILWIIWLIVRRSRKRGRNAVSGTQVKHAGR